MFINSIDNSHKKRIQQLVETLKSTYGFNISGASLAQLQALEKKYQAVQRKIVRESGFNSYTQNPLYAKAVLIMEAARLLIEIQPSRRRRSKLKKPDADGDGIPDWADRRPQQAGGKEDRKVEEARLMESIGSSPYEYQASMARSELYRNAKYATSMMHQIRVEDEIQPWIAASLTKAANYLDKIFHYLDYTHTFEPQSLPEGMDGDPELGETSGSTARQNLLMIMEYSLKLFDMIKPGDHLEGWVAMKLTTASDAISCSKHYMDYVHFENHGLDDHFNEARRARRSVMAESRRLTQLLEDQDLDHAETLLAAKDISDRLQKMAEDAAKMAVDDLMPLVDTMKDQFGLEPATAFNEVLKTHLQTVLDAIIQAKDQTDNAILTLHSGGTPSSPTDIAQAPVYGPTDGTASDGGDGADGGDMDFEKEFEATPPASGPKTEPLGRAKKDEEGLSEAKKGATKVKVFDTQAKLDDFLEYPGYVTVNTRKTPKGIELIYVDNSSIDEGKKGRIPPQFLSNIKKKKAQAAKKKSTPKVTEARARMNCNECGSGMYEQDSRGRMKCNECGSVMVIGEAQLSVRESFEKYIKGVPGECIAQTSNHVLMYGQDRYDAKTTKNEYEVYEQTPKGWSLVANMNMPYVGKRDAIAKFLKTYGTITEDIPEVPSVSATSSKPKAHDLSTQQLTDLASGRPVRDEKNKPITGIPSSDVKKALADREKMQETQVQEKAPPGFDLDLEKKILAQYKDNPSRAYATMWSIHKQKHQKHESQIAQVDQAMISLLEQKLRLEQKFKAHKQRFAARLQQNQEVDPLGLGHGLEGDALREQITQLQQTIHKKQMEKTALVEALENSQLDVKNTIEEISLFNGQLEKNPWGVIGIDHNNKKVSRFFESAAERTLWLNFKSSTLQRSQLIDPQTLKSATKYLKSRMVK